MKGQTQVATKLTRRRALKLLTAGLAGCAAVGGYTWQIEPHRLITERVPLPIQGLPGTWAGKTIVQISDLHIGPQVSSGYIARVFEHVNSLGASLVVITGDFMSCHGPEQIDQVLKLIEILDRGTPTLGILGNHDYAAGWSRQDVAEELTDRLRPRGVEILRNTSQEVQGLRVIGLDDLWAGNFQIEAVEHELASDIPSMALCHNPDAVDLPGWENYRGWILAGHTHGGQCKPPFLPPPLLPVANRRYTSGIFDLSGGRSLYISRGVGHLLKVRFNCRPEVTLFEVQPV